MPMDYIFETRMTVRDYECDIQGIVNNANYLHYCEHTRHLFLRECGLNFAELHEKGTDAVVARYDLRYKTPLKGLDEMISRLSVKKERMKYVFFQDIYRASDNRLCLRAVVEVVCLVNGRLSESKDIDEALEKYLAR